MNFKKKNRTVPTLRACRICLSQDGKLYDFIEDNIRDTYLSFSGLLVTRNDGLPQFICSICRFLLYKSYNFKKKCLDSTLYLRKKLARLDHLTTAQIETPHAKKFNHDFATTEAICYYSPPSDKNTIYLEEAQEESITTEPIKIECETRNEVNTDSYTVIDPIDSNAVTVNTEHVVKLDVETILRKCLEINKAGRNDCSDDEDYMDTAAKVNTNSVVPDVPDENTKECEVKMTKDVETQCDDDSNDVYLVDDDCAAEVISSDENDENTSLSYKKGNNNIEQKNDSQLSIVKESGITKHEQKYISKKEFLKNYENVKYFGKKRDLYEHIYKKYVRKASGGGSTKFNRALDAVFNVNNSSDDDEANSKKKKIQIAREDLNYSQEKFYDFIAKKYCKTRKSGKKPNDINKFGKTYNMNVFILDHEQQKANQEAGKQSLKYVNASYKCELCCRGFMSEQVYQNHMVLHDPSSGRYECKVCHTRFRIKRFLRRHISGRHKFKFQCKSCKQSFVNSTLAKIHFNFHEGFKYECEHCGKMFSKYNSRINHLRIFHGSVACDICGLRFTSNGLNVHKTKAHREMFKCTMCGVQFHNSGALKLHRDSLMDQKCGENIRPCTICGDNFPDNDALQRHNHEHHNERRNRIRDRKLTLALNWVPRPNVKWMMKRKKVTNDETGESEMQEVDGVLKRKKEKQDKVKLVCEICGAEGFTSPCTLRYHQRIHTGEKPHKCTVCDKSFRLAVQLQKHMRTHTGDRPYKCPKCPKAFKTQSALYPHQSVHTKERNHPCFLCDKMFRSATNVKMHIKTVHMKKPPGGDKKPPGGVKKPPGFDKKDTSVGDVDCNVNQY